MKRCRGIALTESLIVLPILLMLFTGVLAGSRLWTQYGALNDVALVSARAAAQSLAPQVQGRLRAAKLGLEPALLVLTTAREGDRFTTRASYPVGPLWLARLWTMTGALPIMTAEMSSFSKPERR
ncbi:MAG: TadE/TadG family type IV pilus assembly protein [Litorivicinus sp.]